jgi:hypothetical protein
VRNLLACLLLTGCASTLRIPGPLGSLGEGERPGAWTTQDDASAQADRGQAPEGVIEAANYYLKHAPDGQPDDCSGFVCAVYARVGVPLDGNSQALWESALLAGATHRRRLPEVGDIVFFDNTYDRNRNRRLDDELTHVAIVLSVDRDGNILMAHGGTSKGRTTLRMNLRAPDQHVDPSGVVLNDYLRAMHTSDPSETRYLSGELWRGFAMVSEADRDAWVDPDADR